MRWLGGILSGLMLTGTLSGAGASWRLALGSSGTAGAVPQQNLLLFAPANERDTLIGLTTLTVARPHDVVLLEPAEDSPYFRQLLQQWKDLPLCPIGQFTAHRAPTASRLGRAVQPVIPWKPSQADSLWRQWFVKPERLVLVSASERRLCLLAAHLAGLLRVPLLVIDEQTPREMVLAWCRQWPNARPLLVGALASSTFLGANVERLFHEADVQAWIRRIHRAGAPVRTLVLVNPADATYGGESLAVLGPWLALQRHAALLLTNPQGSDAATVVREAQRYSEYRQADHVILLANLKALAPQTRSNPIAGKDIVIEMEPLTPDDEDDLFRFAVGRLLAPRRSDILLQLARQRWMVERPTPRRAMVVSNPGSSLNLLETLSRHSALELANCGYRTLSLFGDEVDPRYFRQSLPGQDVVLWEGHHNTLIKDYGFVDWTEPLRPALVVLQSCLALMEPKVQPLLRRGAVAVVGASSRIYSGTGGAFSLAFLDGVLYDHQTLGESLRQAKNFLLLYAQWKENRLPQGARLGGANLRSAWAFTLWGDPTLQLPAPAMPEQAKPAVRWQVQRRRSERSETGVVHHGTIRLPAASHEVVSVDRYVAQLRPNARLAGLLSNGESADSRRLLPLIFLEIPLPDAPVGATPRFRSKLPERHYCFRYDATRRCGYLLLTPRSQAEHEVTFRIEWHPATTALPWPTEATPRRGSE